MLNIVPQAAFSRCANHDTYGRRSPPGVEKAPAANWGDAPEPLFAACMMRHCS